MLMLIFGVAAVVGLFYLYVIKPQRYWKDRGVEQGKPLWLFGHFFENFIGRINGPEMVQKMYDQSPDARYTGMYRFSSPILTVRDPDLIKEITVKDFDSFMDHPQLIPPEADPLWSKNLLNLTGSKWKDTRAHLSPSFTSSKMRGMFTLMTDCADNLVRHLLEKKEDVVTLEIKDLFSRYTNDVIATTAFGINVNSLTNPDNDFYRMGNEAADFGTFRKTWRLLAYLCIPLIKNIMKINIIPEEADSFFRNVIDEAIKTRQEKGIVRADMLHLLLEARKNAQEDNKNLDLSNEDITAHAVIFIIGGFESVSSFLSFTTYELALNPDVQEKLRDEIRATLEECGGKVTYEAISKMKYMDMVVSESLRKWPHFTAINRICTKPYTIQPVAPGEKPVHLDKGMEVFIPMMAIHRDPKYFTDPDRFDPERFSDENMDQIRPYTYFPFGLGPRNCIGSRFVHLEGKILLFHLLSQFEIVPVRKTAIPLKFSAGTLINLKPKGGFWLGLKRSK